MVLYKMLEFGCFTDPPLAEIEDEGAEFGMPSTVWVRSSDHRKNVLALAKALAELQDEFSIADFIGAASPIGSSDRGAVYSNREPNGLKNALRREFCHGRTSLEMPRTISDCCENSISGVAAAKHFAQIVECVANGGARPLPPRRRQYIRLIAEVRK